MKTREVTFQSNYINCRNKSCRLCPHGPYYYMFVRYGSALSSLYIGRKLKFYTLILVNGKWTRFDKAK